ncbi:cysteine biosynthesis protein CysZ [Prosthecomicrobium hirschii]|uniref:sulfate transporter family protein n=1 Tax=Prosthecodimorpha hirschii TaxID=665126 RepID=UPI00112A4CA9|nr:sulfate transporter family protein [Prosthecomicrobium hirschii]TPQ49968.1 cysteine biosynthesis protein CysZ [Prosthecomicrobium hirschii]
MPIVAALRAFSDVFTPPFRSVLIRSLAISVLVLAVIWAAGTRAVAALAAWFAATHPLDYPWYVDAFTTVSGFVSGVLIFIGLAYLVAPVSAIVAGFFLDDVAATVERTHYPADPPGLPVPLWESIGATVKFTALVVVVNLIAFLLLLVPGINLIAFFVGNGYLLGREYFQLAAGRLMPPSAAEQLRARHAGSVFLGGLAMAGLLAVPVLNLVTPLFGIALMVHLVKRLTGARTLMPPR